MEVDVAPLVLLLNGPIPSLHAVDFEEARHDEIQRINLQKTTTESLLIVSNESNLLWSHNE